jgi:hypothetical protein
VNSSTSSSERVYLKIVLAIVLGMGAAMGLVNLFFIANDASAETILGRVMESRKQLPRITAIEEPVVMVFGSSMIQAGFSPRQFDQEMAERGTHLKSFNFGFGGLNPFFQDYFSRRIKEKFDAADKRLALTVIEFNPFQTTQSRWNGAIPAVDSFLTMLASDKELWDITLDDPERGTLLFNIRYLRNNISAEVATFFFFGEPFQAPRERSKLDQDEEMRALRDELGEKLNAAFEEDYPDYDGKPWNWGWQGGGTIPEERSAGTMDIIYQYYDSGMMDYRLDSDRINRVNCCDILEMHFEPLLIEAFIRMVENFQQFSDQVEIVMLPRNTDWIQYSPEARKRLNEAIAQIEQATGVTIRDFQEIDGLSNEMFSDTTHLNRYQGAVRFTHHLVDQFGKDL